MYPLQRVAALDPRKSAITWFDEFKAFAFKGNVIDLAVGVIIGAAFGKIIDALVKYLIYRILDYQDYRFLRHNLTTNTNHLQFRFAIAK